MRARRSLAGPAVAAAWSSRTWARWTATYPLARSAAPRALSASAVTRTSSGWGPRPMVTDGLVPASAATAVRNRALRSCAISPAVSVELGSRTTAVARYTLVWTRDAKSAEAATATAVSAIRPLCRWNGRTEQNYGWALGCAIDGDGSWRALLNQPPRGRPTTTRCLHERELACCPWRRRQST